MLAPRQSPADTAVIDDNLIVRRGGETACAHCGTTVSKPAQWFLAEACCVEGAPTEAGPQIHGDPQNFVDAPIAFRRYACPGCGVSLLTEVGPRDDRELRGKAIVGKGAAA